MKLKAYLSQPKTILGLILLVLGLLAIFIPLIIVTNLSSLTKHVTAIKALPAYSLQYPGSILISQRTALPSCAIDGCSGATSDTIYAFKKTFIETPMNDEILTWYANQLKQQGWTISPNSIRQAQFTTQELLEKGNYYILIGIFYGNQIHTYTPSISADQYSLVYSVNIGEKSYK